MALSVLRRLSYFIFRKISGEKYGEAKITVQRRSSRADRLGGLHGVVEFASRVFAGNRCGGARVRLGGICPQNRTNFCPQNGQSKYRRPENGQHHLRGPWRDSGGGLILEASHACLKLGAVEVEPLSIAPSSNMAGFVL